MGHTTHIPCRLQLRERRMTSTPSDSSSSASTAQKLPFEAQANQDPAFGPRMAHGWLLAVALSLVASLLIVVPFFWYGSASGHDFEFHVASWLDVGGQWREGIVFPRWTEWANHGFGEPRFIFYPPLSWLLGPLLSFLVPWNDVPVAFIVLVQTFAGISAFAFARRILPERAALCGAICYAANPNALLIIYMRSDYAELLASAFFPLFFWATLELGGVLQSIASTRRATAFFSVVFAAVWLSNAPAGVMASYSAVLLFAWMAFTKRFWKPLIRGASGIALGFGLASFYLLPAAYEQQWVNIGQALSSGLLPSQNFLYTAINDPEHTLFNWIASTTAIVMAVTAALASLAARRRIESTAEAGPRPYRQKDAAEGQELQRGHDGVGEEVWRALLLAAAVATMMMLRPTSVLWVVLPKLRFVQFPWRWMSILSVPFSYFVTAAAAKRRVGWIWGGSVLMLLAAMAIFFVRATWWDSDDVATLRAGIAAGTGFDGVDEYDPLGDDHYNLPAKAPPVKILADAPGSSTSATILVQRWNATEKKLRITSGDPVRIGLRLLNYPAWRVELNGSQVIPESAADSGQMVVGVPAGESNVSVRFIRTGDRTLGGLLSLLSGLVTLGFLARADSGR
jgi:hypothetical protein